MIDLFQITGSASFAVRAALEEGGIPYTVHDVHPSRRTESPGFAEANPLLRVATIRDGDVAVYETGAVLLYLVERFPEANLGPLPGEPGRGDLLRWVTYCANTLHTIWYPLQSPAFLSARDGEVAGIEQKGREKLEAAGAYLEGELAGSAWCLGERFSVADIYLYMLTGWQGYSADGTQLGGPHVQGHFARVGARPAIARTRELDDLDERLQRLHPELRGGKPI
ncbi:MAG: glutathione S-transferase family protein [Gaiella sp.]